jgi:hypothetical protein
LTSLARVGASELFGPDEEQSQRRVIGASELFGPDEISEEEANRTLTPDEQAMVARANEPRFGAGLAKRMEEYQGLSPEDAAAKYRAGWSDTIGNVYDTVTDSRKLASAAGNVVEAGVNAVANPRETARKIGNYYYENPDAAVTDAAFAAFPGRQVLATAGKAIPDRPPSSAMPRSAVRDEAELLSTGGKRMEDAKLDPSKVDADAIESPLKEFREKTKTTVIDNPKINNIIKRLVSAYTPKKPSAMSPMTKVAPEPRPPVTLTELHGHQTRLDDVINGPGKGPDGRINSQGRAAIELKKAIGKMIDDHPESGSFKVGKHEYSRGKASQELGDVFEKAQARRQWHNGDEAGALANEIKLFLGKRSNRYKLTRDQRVRLAKLGKLGWQGTLGAFGSGTVSGMVMGRAAEALMGLPPAAMMGPGMLARQSRNARVVAEFKRIQDEIRAGGPIE